MARTKTDEKTNEAKKHIIREAIEIIVDDGMQALTMSNIAARLNMSKPAIYWYFENKDSLIFGINDYVRCEYIDSIKAISEDKEINAVEKLERVVSFAEHRGGNDLKMCIVSMKLLLEYLTKDCEMRAALKKSYDEYITHISRIVEQGMDEGTFRKDIDPFVMAVFLVGALDGSLQQTVLHYGRERINSNIKQGRNFLIGVFKRILIENK